MDKNTRVVIYADVVNPAAVEAEIKKKLGLTYVAVVPSNYAFETLQLIPEEPDLSAFGIGPGNCDCLDKDDVVNIIEAYTGLEGNI